MTNFDICQFLATPGPFEYFVKKRCLQKINFFSMKERRGFDEGGGLGGQIPRLYGGTIFGGVTHLGHLAGHLAQKFRFLDTFAAA